MYSDTVTAAERYELAFGGCEAADYPLTWAQRWVYDRIRGTRERPAMLNVPYAATLPDGLRLPDVLDAIRRVVERHEALRARFYAAGGSPRQAVAGAGRLDVAVYDAPADRVDELGKRVVADLIARPYGADELPLRIAVLTTDGRPAVVALALSHLAADALSAWLVTEEIAALSRDPSAERPSAWQLGELLAYERGPRGARQAERAAEHWRDQIRRAPNTALPIRGAASRFAAWEMVLESAAVSAAALRLGERYQVDEPSAILAAYCMVAGSVAGRDFSTLSIASANRTRPQARATVGNLFQYAPATVRATGSLREVVSSAQRGLLTAYRFGHYDPALAAEVREQVRYERGVGADLSCGVNFALPSWSPYSGERADTRRGIEVYRGVPASVVRGLRAESTTKPFDHAEPVPLTLSLAVWWLAESATLALSGDSRLFDRADLERMLRSVESVLVEAACHDDPDVDTAELLRAAGVAAPRIANGLELVDGCWIDPDEVRDLVSEAVRPAALGLYVAHDPDGPARIEAYLVGHGLTPESAHQRCVAALPGRRFAATPAHYVICAEAPRDQADRRGWLGVPVLAAGSGRGGTDGGHRPPDDGRARAVRS